MPATPVYNTTNYDLSTDIGKLRMVINDVSLLDTNAGVRPDGTFYADEELQVFIDLAGSWKRAVSLVLRALATAYARLAVVQEMDGRKEDTTRIADKLQDAASKWDEQLDRAVANAATDAAATVSWSSCFGFDDGAPRIFGVAQYGANIADAA